MSCSKTFSKQVLIVSNRQVGPGHHILSMQCAPIAKAAKPGQFALLRSPLPGMPLLNRPFSIYGADARKGGVEFLVKEVGTATRMLCSQPEGSQVIIIGPLGQPFEQPKGKRVVLIGGGTGVAPLAFFAQKTAGKGKIQAIIGARSRDLLFGRDRFPEESLMLVTEDGSEGEKGLPTEILAKMLSNKPKKEPPFAVLACGPLKMMAEVAEICRSAGVECQVSLENQLGCGLGACYGCVIPGHEADGSPCWMRVCTDGPVFAAERIDWKRFPTLPVWGDA